MNDRPEVLFIGGYTRSGSTLLDRVLGTADGYLSAGEIRHIWREGLRENRLCGCGIPFRACPFWTDVFSDAFGAMDALDSDSILELKDSVDRFWRIPQIRWSAAARTSMRSRLDEYRSLLEALYASIRRVSGCRVIIDSTKDSSHGHLLSTMNSITLHVVHLVRDSRAVARSWQRRKFNPGSGREMDRYGLLRTALGWDATNSLVSWLGRHSHNYVMLRYEDFVADPAAATESIYSTVGIHGRTPTPTDGQVELRPDHTVAGNPIRFQHGPIEIRSDDEWKTAMGASSRLLVASTTWPMLKMYGFE